MVSKVSFGSEFAISIIQYHITSIILPGAMVAIYGMDRPKMHCNQMYCHYRMPKKFLEEMSMDNALFWVDAVALIGIFFALRIIAYFVLRWKLHMIR